MKRPPKGARDKGRVFPVGICVVHVDVADHVCGHAASSSAGLAAVRLSLAAQTTRKTIQAWLIRTLSLPYSRYRSVLRGDRQWGPRIPPPSFGPAADTGTDARRRRDVTITPLYDC